MPSSMNQTWSLGGEHLNCIPRPTPDSVRFALRLSPPRSLRSSAPRSWGPLAALRYCILNCTQNCEPTAEKLSQHVAKGKRVKE